MTIRLRTVLLLLPLIALFRPAACLVQGQTLTYAGPQPSLNFGSVNICAAGSSTSSPCTETLSLSYNVTAGGTLGTPKVLTLGAPNLDFTLAAGGTCTGTVTTGTTCTVKVTFAPEFGGSRTGAVELTGNSGNLLATTLIYGNGVGPQVVFDQGALTTTPIDGFIYQDTIARMVVDGGGNLFVSDNVSRVLKLPAGGGTQTSVGAGFSSPEGLAIDGAGNLLIADKNHNRVVKVLAANGSQTTVGTGLLQPNSVAVDSAGDVFISDAGNQRVVEVPVGDGGQSIVYDGSADGENITQITADGPGNLFILTSTENSPGNSVTNRSFWVVKIPAGGGAETTVFTGNSSEDPIEVSGNYPVSTAVDGAGNLYVGVLAYSESPYSGFQTDSVVEIQAVGSVQTNVLVNSYPPDVLPDLSPFQMALDQSGNLFLNYSWLSLSIIEDARSLPPALNFGTTDGAASPQSVSVGNIGNTALAITNISFDNLNFSRVPGGSGTGLPPDCATGSQLATGTACNVSIAFTPTTTGPLTGGLTLKDNSLNTEGGMQTIPLSGTATVVHPAAGLQVSPSSLNFGSVPFGSMAFGGFTVTNVDGGTGIVSFALSINGPSYTVSENDCGGTIVPGASCAVYVEYSPITVGVHNDLLTLVTPLPNNPVVSLLGSATGIAPSTSSLPFGPIPFGTTELLLLTIQDVGVPSATFTTSINGPSYKILTTGNTCLSGLTAGHSCTLPVEFDPVSAGLHDDTLTVTPSSAAPFTVALTGSASTVAPTVPVLDFGSIPFGTTNLLTLTIKDVGAPGTVTLTSSINGPSYKILTAGNTCLSGLTNGQSCTLPVEFDPVAVGLHNDYLTVTPSAGAVSVVPLLGSASKP